MPLKVFLLLREHLLCVHQTERRLPAPWPAPKYGLCYVMRIRAVRDVHVQVDACICSKCFQKLLDKFGIEIPNFFCLKLYIKYQCGSSADVYGNIGKCLLHGDACVGKAPKSLLSPNACFIPCPRHIPTSSTVWWSSTIRSPLALIVRSNSPCLVSKSSMWSRKPTPVLMLLFPLPSMLIVSSTFVSLVFLLIVAVRFVMGYFCL